MAKASVDIQSTIRCYLRMSHGYLYLPEENVEPAMDELSRVYANIHVETVVQKDGIRKLVVYRLTAKTMRRAFMVYIH